MTSIAYSPVSIQTSTHSVPSVPSWFGEVTLLVHHLKHQGVLTAIEEQVRFARRRFGRYEVIDFVAVLFGYAISGERTLEAFYERLQPSAVPFMALFDRDQLPARSTLSRFLAALSEVPVEALRTLFLDDLLSSPLSSDKQTGGLRDRTGNAWVVFDIDGTREAARQRALPQRDDLPEPFRRLDDVCAAFLSRPQARASGPDADGHQSSPQLPMARFVWESRERSLPRGVAPGSCGDHALPHRVPTSAGAYEARGSTGNMAPELRSPIFLASPL